MLLVHLLDSYRPIVDEVFLTPLIEVQSLVRDYFGWAYEDDLTCALEMSEIFSSKMPSGVEKWANENRSVSLQNLERNLNSAEKVIIVGAAIEDSEIEGLKKLDCVIIAADGSVGAVKNLNSLTCVVTDFDGNPHLDQVAENGVTFIAHVHGDNREKWKQSLTKWEFLPNPPEIILSHQVKEEILGMYNFGGFTDGDRAVCLALYLGVPIHKITLIGFSTKQVGKWSGETNKERKLLKLNWMFRILSLVGLANQVEN